MKYAFIENHRHEFSIHRMCSVLEVSTSGYYEWRGRPPSRRALEDQRQGEMVEEIMVKNRHVYGSRRVLEDLIETGEKICRPRVIRLMRLRGLRCKTKRKFKVTTDSSHQLPVAENLLDRQFTTDRPNQVYVGDITYIWTSEGWLYLSVLIDLYSRMVVGWSMSNRMKADLVCDAMMMAIWKRRPSKGMMIHSDRGSQYASRKYQRLLEANGFKCSMSRKGDCWDNAPAESFFHTLKIELVHHHQFATREEAKQAIFEYIEVFYNRQRRHSANGYRSPEEYEKRGSKVA